MQENFNSKDGAHSDNTTPGPSSTFTEPGTPIINAPANVLISTSDDHQMVSMPGAAVSGISLDDVGSIIAADLGDMLDAIIIEHSGTLDKVITNIRDGVVGKDRMQKLSHDLAVVSEAVAAVPDDQLKVPSVFVRERGPGGKHSMVLDMEPAMLRKRTQSVPQLLAFIDAAANDLRLNLSNALGGSEDKAGRSDAEKQALAADTRPARRAKGTELYLPGRITPYILTPDASALNTPEASNVQKQLGVTSQPTPPQTPPPTPPLPSYTPYEGPTTLPSEVLKSRDLAPLPLPIPKTMTPSPSPTKTTVSTAPPDNLTRNPGPVHGVEASSHPVAKVQADPKALRHVPSMKLAPYQRPRGSPAPRAAGLVKPSEVAGKQKQQKTFEQQWLRESIRASSSTERAMRRDRVLRGDDGKGGNDGKGGDVKNGGGNGALS